MSGSVSIDLVVPTVGRTSELERLLESVAGQTWRGPLRVLVVDQNDDDRLVPVLAGFEGRLQIERLHSALGLSRACNVGFAHCTADIVGRPDDDCWYAPDTLERVVRAFAEHPEWDALSGMSCDGEGCPTQLRWDRRGGVLSRYNLWRRAISFTVFMRGSAVEEVGPWDESYGNHLGPDGTVVLGGSEDSELLLRALSRGMTVGYEPSIRIGHPDFRPRLRDSAAMRKAYAYGRDHSRLLEQYGYPRSYIAWRGAQLLAGSAYFLLRGELGRARFYGGMARGRLRGTLGGGPARPTPAERPHVVQMVSAELDTAPPGDPEAAGRTYLVCSTPRSGSTLLCTALQQTGLAGTPTEYFNIDFRGPLAGRWGTRGDLGGYVRELRARRSSPDGVFGAKLHWTHLDEIRREVNRTTGRAVEPGDSVALLAELFPDATYVHVRRADTDRQAVSYWKAAYTGVWHRGAGERAARRAEVPYNFRAIRRLKAEIRRDDTMWQEAFARSGVRVIDVTYEDLVAAYRPTISSLVEQTTGHVLAAADVPPPELRPQTDENTEALLERFRRDAELARRPVLEDARDLALDLWVRARTFPYGAVARERLSEIARSRPSR